MTATNSKKPADLRCCASCMWIYRLSDPFPQAKLDEGFSEGSCPQCGFASYSARYVFGDKAYRYAISQKPWLDRQMTSHEFKLLDKIEKENPIKPKKPARRAPRLAHI